MVKFWLWVRDEKGFYRMEPWWNIILPIFWHFIFTKAIWNIKKYTLPAFNILYMYIKSLLSWVWPLHKNIYKPKHKTHPTNTQTLNLTMIVTGKTINSQPPKIYNNFQFHHILAMRVCWIWDTQKPMLFGISEVKPGTSHLQVSSLFMHAGVQTTFKSYSKRKDFQIIT